jgi:hypothetical protein
MTSSLSTTDIIRRSGLRSPSERHREMERCFRLGSGGTISRRALKRWASGRYRTGPARCTGTWSRSSDDSKTPIGTIPPLFAQDRSQDRQKEKPRDLQKPCSRRGSRTRSAVFQAAMRRAEELSLRGGAGPTNALFSLREVAVTSRTLCPDPKKTRRRSVAGKGESMLESVRTDRSG